MAEAKPVFYLLAGPNGAGKSTLYKALCLTGTIPLTAEFVNETVFSLESKLALIEQAHDFFECGRALRLARRITRHPHRSRHVQRQLDQGAGQPAAALGASGVVAMRG